jgi:murein DD-endopeptidase MepM/ murein hydrolase activator NlpD
MAALAVSLFGLFTIGYLTATAYLVLRDDLIGASMARQARMQHEYEDRIAALRAQLDRITSRQLLDQQVVEEKVEKLMEQQMALTNRQGKLGSVLERAENSGLDAALPDTPDAAPLDEVTNGDHAALDSFDTLLGNRRATDRTAKTRALAFVPAQELGDGTVADRADRLFSKMTLSLKGLEQGQLDHIRSLTADAQDRARNIGEILSNTGVPVPAKLADAALDETADSAIGGPYLAPESATEFENSIADLDLALDRFEHVKALALKLPFANPAPNRQITSLFGNRVDPFFGKLAMHAGIDFRQKTGSEVHATGAGIVIHAGTAGGYGNMVEIDHGNGITTRYGHLSKILVKEGDTVEAGDLIALSGSTGRSTGPHLHYEVRRDGVAVDPMRFLNAGLKLTSYL